MFRSAIPLGRWMGVDLRLHISFPLLLAACLGYGALQTNNAARGVGLFAGLVFAVIVREVSRALAASYAGLQVRALFLMPVGGVMALSTHSGASAPPVATMRRVGFVSPAANLLTGLLMLGASYAFAPGANLLAQPWIAPEHVLRSFIWTQFAMAVVGLLPLLMLPAQRMLGGKAAASAPELPSFGPGSGFALAMVAAGMITMNVWLIAFGCMTLLFSQLQTQRVNDSLQPDDVRVGDVMVSDFAVLSTSDTLQSALARTARTMQDVFPVVRGDRLVGAVARQSVIEQLQNEGDGYLQGIMTRGLQLAAPDEPLMAALRRASSRGSAEFVPVAQDGRLLGILTPQNLGRAVLVARAGRQLRPQEPQ